MSSTGTTINVFYLRRDAHGARDVNAEEEQGVGRRQELLIGVEEEEAILGTVRGAQGFTERSGQLPVTEVTIVNLLFRTRREN